MRKTYLTFAIVLGLAFALPVCGQDLRRSYEYTSPNSATRIQLYEDQVYKIREMVGRSLVRIYAGDSRGSGCYIGKSGDGRDLFLTANHVVGRRRTGRLRFYHGYECNYHVLGVDRSSDIALLQGVDSAITWEGCQVSTSDPRIGDAVVGYGYGGDERVVWIPGLVQQYSYATDQSVRWMEFEYNARPGDSGGPVYSPEGALVGIVWGAERPGNPVGGHTMASIASRIRKFIQAVCPGGRCQPPARPTPPGGRRGSRQPDIIPRPDNPPDIPEPPDVVPELTERIEALEGKVQNLKSCECDPSAVVSQEDLQNLRLQSTKVLEEIVIELKKQIDSHGAGEIDYEKLSNEVSRLIANRLYVKIRTLED